MADKTQTWVSKADRSKKLTVKVPFFANAVVDDGKGGREMARSELESDWEPQLTPATPAGIDLGAPADDRLDRLMTQLGIVTQRVNAMGSKIDEVHAIVVPQPDKGATRS